MSNKTNIEVGDVEGSLSGNIAGGDIIINQQAPPPDPYLPQLATLVRSIWVEQYLHNALLQAIYIDLGLQQQPSVIPQPFADVGMMFQHGAPSVESLPELAEGTAPSTGSGDASANSGVFAMYQQAQG